MQKPDLSFGRAAGGRDRLRDLEGFGSNPGNLRARIYEPKGAPGLRALVVVLHGCTQTAAGYDIGAGWSALADEQGFLLLFPEQQRANNPNLCFNWFSPNDTHRDQGEVLSIRQMIATLVEDHDVDPARIFVTGLSAGGAMASAMLACYPELFAGGAIVAGLPYGSASGVPQALERMRGQGLPDPDRLDALLRRASRHDGPWPVLSVWHGTSDTVVDPANADAIVAQWRPVHGVGGSPAEIETVAGHIRRVWRDAGRRVVIEQYEIRGMGHGIPLGTAGAEGIGAAGPYMFDVGLSSTRRIAAAWELGGARAAGEAPVEAAAAAAPHRERPEPMPATLPALRTLRPERIPAAGSGRKGAARDVGRIITDALRAAGLMR